MKSNITVLILFLFKWSFCWSALHLSPVFSDGMVLQQQSEVAIWGTADANTEIRIRASWGATIYSGFSDNKGNWKIKIKTISAGGPHRIVVEGENKILLKNVLLGEVWFCSGQSNMDMTIGGRYNDPVAGAMDAIMTRQNTDIHVFTVKNNMKSSPQTTCDGQWLTATTSNIGSFSAVAFYFACLLNKVLDVPVGIITSSVGGSRIEAWMSEKSFAPYKEINGLNPGNASILFNGMLYPLAGYGIKGVLWYQGEANKDNPKVYPQLFKSMVEDWRKRWEIGEFPFYYVQIAPFDYNPTNKKEALSSAYIREAQLKCLDIISNTGMAVLSDIGNQKTIHPSQKEKVGHRLAYMALAKTYGIKGFEFSSPIYESMKIEGNRIILQFGHAPSGLSTYGEELTGFEIAGKDHVFYPAKAHIKNEAKVEVYSEKVKAPVAVRYGFKDYFKGVLYNTYGLPASSFRTDNWETNQ